MSKKETVSKSKVGMDRGKHQTSLTSSTVTTYFFSHSLSKAVLAILNFFFLLASELVSTKCHNSKAGCEGRRGDIIFGKCGNGWFKLPDGACSVYSGTELVFFFFLAGRRQGLAMLLRLTSNSPSSCLSLPKDEIVTPCD